MTSAQPSVPTGEWPLVARATEIELCRANIDAGRGVIIAGSAGVGKTRLAREIADALDAERSVLRVAPTGLTIPLSALSPAGTAEACPVIVLDDAQLLDDDAAALVHRLVVQREIVLVATLRTGEDVPAAVTAMWKDEHLERVDLREFDRAEVDELLDEVLDGPIDASSRRMLWEATQGSPLMLRELVRSALVGGTLVDDDGLWRLVEAPRSVRLDELVSERLDALDPAARHVVELVALGEPVGFTQLVAEVGTGALAAAEDSGLIEAITDGLRREVRLAHPIFGDVARRSMGEARTAERCRELLGYLEATPLRRRDDIVRSVAWQLRAGGTAISADMVLAARRALYDRQEQLAIDLALRAMDDESVDAALVLGVAFTDRGDHERADQVLRDFGGEIDDEQRAMIAVQRADAMFWGLGRAAETHRLLRDAEAELAPGPWRDTVTASRAVILSNEGRVAEALKLAEPLLDGDDTGRAFVTASVAATASLALSGRGREAKDLASRAYVACDALGEQLALPDRGLFVVLGTMAAHDLGELADSEAVARAVHDFTVSNGDRAGQAWGALTLGRALLTRGRISEASQRFGESAAAFASIHQRGPRRWALAGLTMCAALRADVAGAEEAWAELVAVPDHPGAMMSPEVGRAEAWVSAVRGDVAGAIDRLHQVADTALAAESIVLAGAALHDVVRLGGQVEPSAWNAVASCQGRLGFLRAAVGAASSERSGEQAMECSRGFTEIGADLFAAEAALLAADLFDADGDTRAATRARRSASDAQNATGEDWFSTLDRGAAPVTITGRELDVATRAAAGMTSRMIADELGISVRTVDNHLQRVYEKLGIRGRRELTPALALL
ncbi:helix-turn-helix transcriptional regulator [Ilumatobacter coccineus]|uniref:helix-turn-helix transcriptional regulator n=1 Tax=Ilumatobacter coccineus TaxID=467094 RepID=UPI000349D32F|nr:LuxR C-terminal-related transcriptional regulator [Ilumatobacter coccineus]